MSFQNSIELFLAINLFTVGLSHVLQPKMWVDYFNLLSSKGNAGNVINALLHLGFGSFILSFYLIGSSIKVIISVYGLLLTLKGSLFLINPKLGLASIRSVTLEKAIRFKWIGLIMVFFSILIFYSLLSN